MTFTLRAAILLAGLLAIAGGAPAAAQTSPVQTSPSSPTAAAPGGKPAAPAPAISPAQARDILDTLNDPKKRAAFAATLEAITKALPAPPPAPPLATPPADEAPQKTTVEPVADAAAAPAAPTAPLTLPLKPDSLGARLLVSASDVLSEASAQAEEAVATMDSLPALWSWAVAITTDPWGRSMLEDTSWRLLCVFGAGLLAEYAVRRLLRRPRDALAERGSRHAARDAESTPATTAPVTHAAAPPDAAHPGADAGHRWKISAVGMLHRLPLTVARLLLDLLPVVTFLVAAHLVLGTPIGGSIHARLVLIALVAAYATCLTILCVLRSLLAPAASGLRLLDISDATADYAMRWSRRLVVVTVFGYALGEAGRLLGLSDIARDALTKVVGLVDHVMVAIIVLQKRRAVRDWIRAPGGSRNLWAQLRNRVAPMWHWIALFYIVALWVVWAIEVPDGFSAVLRIFVLTAAVTTLMRVVLILLHGTLDRVVTPSEDTAARYPGIQARLRVWRPILHVMVDIIVYAVTFVQLLQVWGFGAIRWLTGTDLGRHVLSAFTSVMVTVVLALAVWEVANHAVERRMARLAHEAQMAAAARLRTLLPMLRTLLMAGILTVVGLLVLSEIGVNTAPLLAGAGVLGIAIGFGSQKLVQDFITGLFLLMENTMQVGDVVSLGGLTGTVEDLTVRAIRLRAEDGSVHVIPFSAVTTVTNMTRDFGHAVIEVGVAYKEDYDRVVAVMRDIVDAMRREPRWEGEIHDELEVMGLNAFGDSSVMIKARIKCGPFGRWSVLREFNRRVKARFDEEGIEIPFPHQALVLNQPITIAGAGASRPAGAPLAPVPAPMPAPPLAPAPSQPQVAAR